MDAMNRAMMNVSGLDILGSVERAARWIGTRLLTVSMRTVNAVRAWNQAQKGRRALLSMSDHMLKDIGISRMDAVQHAKWKNRF